jgi:hypothetical protein
MSESRRALVSGLEVGAPAGRQRLQVGSGCAVEFGVAAGVVDQHVHGVG